MSVQLDVTALAEVAPLLRRMVALDAGALVRLRRGGDRLSALVQTPFGVLAARSIQVEAGLGDVDVTWSAADALHWVDGERSDQPPARDADWRGAIPPHGGWEHIDQVPDDVIRSLVRSGAMTLKEAADREGVPGASPRAEVADVLLDTVVLTVSQEGGAATAEVTLRVLSALTRLGFLARGSYARVDRNGRWVRVAGPYGTVYRESAGLGLTLLR